LRRRNGRSILPQIDKSEFDGTNRKKGSRLDEDLRLRLNVFTLFVAAAGAQDTKTTGLPKPATDLQPGAYHYQVKIETGGQVMNLKSSGTIQDGGAFWTAIAVMETPGGTVTDTTTIEKTTLILHKRHLSRDRL